MDKLTRNILNITFLVPLIFAWGLLVKKNFPSAFVYNLNLPIISVSEIFNSTEGMIRKVQNFKNHQIARVMQFASSIQIAKNDPKAEDSMALARVDAAVDLTATATLPAVKNDNVATASAANSIETLVKVENQALPEKAASEVFVDEFPQVASDQDNQKPLTPAMVNNAFNKNILRMSYEDGVRSMNVKAEALLMRAPNGVAISKNNLKFLEKSFAAFKTRFGISKIIVSAPSDANEEYLRKVSRFMKKYFTYDMQFVSEHPTAQGFEVIIVGDSL